MKESLSAPDNAKEAPPWDGLNLVGLTPRFFAASVTLIDHIVANHFDFEVEPSLSINYCLLLGRIIPGGTDMWKAALAGALLATIGSSLAMAENQIPAVTQVSASSGVVESRIAHFKAALRLSVEQERHWPRVAAALRQIVQSYNSDESNSGGLVQRIGTRASNVVLNANAIRLLVAAAQPLMKSLDPEQKQHALVLARNMGFGGAAAHFE